MERLFLLGKIRQITTLACSQPDFNYTTFSVYYVFMGKNVFGMTVLRESLRHLMLAWNEGKSFVRLPFFFF